MYSTGIDILFRKHFWIAVTLLTVKISLTKKLLTTFFFLPKFKRTVWFVAFFVVAFSHVLLSNYFFLLCRIGLPKYSQLFQISETKLQKTFFLLCVCNVFFFIQKAINYIVIICLINQIISVRKKANQNQHSKVKQCAWKEEKYSEEKREKKTYTTSMCVAIDAK